MTKKTGGIALASFASVVVVSLLTSCTSTAELSSPTSASSTSASTTVTHKVALDTVTIGPDGLGPVKIAAPVPTGSPSTSIVTFKADYCLAQGRVGEPYVGAWVPNYRPETGSNTGTQQFIVITNRGVRDGSVRSIILRTAKVATAAGIRVGSTEAAVKSAYPRPDFVLRGHHTRMYVIDKGVGRMVIEIAIDDQKGYWEPDLVGKVLWIVAQRSDTKAQSIVDYNDGCGK